MSILVGFLILGGIGNVILGCLALVGLYASADVVVWHGVGNIIGGLIMTWLGWRWA